MKARGKVSVPSTRSNGPVLNPDLVFVEYQKPTTQLPDIACVIGMVKFHLREGMGIRSEKSVMREVSKQVYSKWWHDTVYCISLEGIVKKVTKLWTEYKEGVKRLRAGRETSGAVVRYKGRVLKC